MCIAIGHAPEPRRGPLGRLWWRLAGSPWPLFATSALVQAIILLAALPCPFAVPALTIAGLLLFGWLFTALPRWSGKSEVHYSRYMGVALALNGGLFLLRFDPEPFGASILLLAAGWLLGVATIRTYLPWVRSNYRPRARFGASTALLLAGGVAFFLSALSLSPAG